MTVSHAGAPAAPPAPAGRLRVALVGTRRQFLGANLSNVAALGLILLGGAGWVFDTMWLYSEPALLGEQGYTLGPLFIVASVLILIASPGRVVPRTVDGSRMRALASGPMFRRRVHTELHGAELYKARRYLPSVVALALLWIGSAAAYYLLFREERADPDVTAHAGAQVAVVLLAAGVAAVLLLLPGRSRRTVLVDDEGGFFADPETRTPTQAAPVDAVAAMQPAAPVSLQQTTAARSAKSGRGGMAIGLVVGVLVTVLALVAAAAFFALRSGEARSPSEVTDLFGQARVKCLDYDVIIDSTSTKALGCRTDDAQIITVTTYGDVPTSDEWLSESCQASEGSKARLRRGYYLVGNDFILDMHQLRHPDSVKVTPMDRTATRLARVLDAAAVPYRCNAQ